MNDNEQQGSRRLERAFAAAELCYGRGLSQKQAATELGTSPATVSRLLKIAQTTGLLRITFHRPPNLILSHALQQRLPELRHVIVGGTTRDQVANVALAFFEERERSGQVIVLDGGLTVASFVEGLSFETFRELQIVPIAADPPTYEQSASENAVRMSAKYSTATSIRLPQFRGPFLDPLTLKAQQVARRARCVVLSVGPFRDGFSALEFTKHLGLDPVKVRTQHPNAVAAVGYCAIDLQGTHIPLPEVDERLLKALAFSELQKLAMDAECDVILVAHSAEKAAAVQAALHARICNTLVVDEELAESLCQRVDDRDACPGTNFRAVQDRAVL